MTKKLLSSLLLFLLIIAGALFLVAGALVIMWPILHSPGLAPGADTGSHVYIAQFIVEQARKLGHLPHIIPYWYCNWEVLHNSPRITPLVMAALYYFIEDPEKLSRVTQLVFLAILALVTYFTFLRRFSWFNALLGALLFAFSQTILIDLSWIGGSYPRILAVTALPPAFLLFNNLLEEKRPRLNIVLLVLVLSFALLTHALVGLMIILMLSVYGLIRELIDRKIRGVGFFMALVGVFLTGLFCAFYIVPFLLEKTGWTSLPPEIPGASLTWEIIISREGRLLGPLLLVFLIFKRRKTPLEMALLYTIIFAFVFSFGDAGYLYRIFRPLNIYPFVASFFYNFGISYLVISTFDFNKIRWWGKVLAGLLLAGVVSYQLWAGYTQSKAWAGFKAHYYRMPQTMKILAEIKNIPSDGRMMPMRYPFPDYTIWWAPIFGIPMVEGWYYSTTPQGKHIAWIYDAIHYGFAEYGVRRLRQLNVRFFLANSYFYKGNNQEQFMKFLTALEEDGFREVAHSVAPSKEEIYHHLFYKDTPSSYFFPLEEKILVVGRSAPIATTIIPGAIQGGSEFLDDYDEEILAHFNGLVLAGFKYHNRGRAEELVKNFVRQGGKVVIDLYQAEGSRLEDVPTFLGVTGQRQIATGDIPVETTPNGLVPPKLLPTAFPKPGELNLYEMSKNFNVALERRPVKEWRYVEYLNLDHQLVARKASDNGGLYGLIGYKIVAGQPVWFVGPNYFYHTFLTHSQKQLALLQFMLGKKTGISESAPGVQIQVIANEAEYKKISYTSPTSLALLVSYTHSPHWRAYLDGQPIKIYNLEDLMVVAVPAGQHQLQLRYEETSPHIWGRVITGLTAILLLALIYLDIRRKKNEAKTS